MDLRFKEFILRRAHSLTGMVPMGVFLFEHFFTNSYASQGEAVYNEKVHFLTTLPYLHLIEWGALFLPFLFHIFYGLYIMYTGEYTVRDTSNGRAWLYFIQRVTAIPALAFIFYHVWTTRFGNHGPDPNFYLVMMHKFENPAIVAFYVIGILSICVHFANGIATFCMTWGLTVSPRSQQLVGAAGLGVGIILAAMAINSIFGFTPEGLEKAKAAPKPPEAVSLLVDFQGAIRS